VPSTSERCGTGRQFEGLGVLLVEIKYSVSEKIVFDFFLRIDGFSINFTLLLIGHPLKYKIE
jgi:hypothetical protein